MQHSPLRSVSGFTLLETVVATGILVTALAGLAQLFILSARLTEHSGRHSSAVFAAQAKMESLLADPAIEPSPPDALLESLDGFSEPLDHDGQITDTDSAETVFVRRWSITPLDDLTPEALVIEVCVFRAPAAAVPLSSAESCLATVRSRQP